MARRKSSRKARGKVGVRTSNELDGSEISNGHRRPRHGNQTKGTVRASSSNPNGDALADVVDQTNDDGAGSAVAMDATAAAAGPASHGQGVNDTTNHPPDCQCYLRRLNKSLFLPPSLTMMMDDELEAGNERSKR